MKKLVYRLLKNLEGITKIDNVYLAKYGSFITIGKIVSAAVTFLLSVAYAHYVPKEIFGDYKFLLSVVGIIGITGLGGIDVAVVQAVTRGLSGTLKRGLKLKLKWGLFGSVLSLGCAFYFWYFAQNPALAKAFMSVALFLPIYQSAGIFQSFLLGRKLFLSNTVFTTVIKIVSSATLVLVMTMKPSLTWLVLANLGTFTILNVIILLWVIKKYKPNEKVSEEAIVFGKKISFLDALSLLSAYLDQLLVFNFLGPIQLAICTFAKAPEEQLKGAWKPFKDLMVPKFVERPSEDIKKTIYRKMALTGVLTVGVIITYILLAPWFFRTFFPNYMEAVLLSQVYILAFISQPVLITTAVFEAKLKTDLFYKIRLTLESLQIVGLIVFLSLFGIWGLIGVKVGINFIRLFLHLYFVKKI